MSKYSDAFYFVIVIIILISVIFILSYVITDNLKERKNSIDEIKKQQQNIELFKHSAIEGVMNEYNFKSFNGTNLTLIASPFICGESCYNFSFEYHVFRSDFSGLKKIRANVVVIDGELTNISLTEIFRDSI
jgi:hypothetical protein